MSSVPVDKRNHLLAFVALEHQGQKRKYTGEPYLVHLQAVANMADGACRLGYEIGLCHDLFEDTDCTDFELIDALQRFGYEAHEIRFIVHAVIELTDVYITERFPQLNREKRKSLERDRLAKITYDAQTVKYCDLMDNTVSIVKHDPDFAKVYVKEKEEILNKMKDGNPIFYKRAKKSLKTAQKQLLKQA